MGQYAECAISAVEAFASGSADSITVAWEKSKSILIDHDPKGCPDGAFLGLCEAGLVVGVPRGVYLKPGNYNKDYAIDAVLALARDPSLASRSQDALWRIVTSGRNVKHNTQMDIVLTLWRHDLIDLPRARQLIEMQEFERKGKR